jgi:BirA family biotin operon repressor/biotin-[acetyl-CoA-carboxylase] ligase
MTREQTGGRGRRGKGWSWIPGNHAASLLWPVPAGLELGAVEQHVVRPFQPEIRAASVHARPAGPAQRPVTVGIGINVAGAPDGLPYPATSLAAAGYAVDAPGLEDSRYAAPAGVDVDRSAEARRRREPGLTDAGKANVHAGGRSVAGIFETIDEGGRLVVRLEEGGHLAVSARGPPPPRARPHGCGKSPFPRPRGARLRPRRR